MAKRLTDIAIRQAKPTDKEYQLSANDPAGLFLRVRPNGTKDWLFRYMHDGKRRKLLIGKYPGVSLKDAQAAARPHRDSLDKGQDPYAQKRAKEAAELAERARRESLPKTVRELFLWWKEKELRSRIESGKRKGRKDNGEETQRKFEKDVFPRIGDLPIDMVRRAHVLTILDEIKNREAPRIAGIILTELRQMFTFAVDREYLVADPLAGMTRKKHGGNAGERDRVLSEVEIRQLASILPRGIGEVQQCAIWIMLATCCRVGEITRAAWSDIDFDNAMWTIPTENSKNSKAHIINLSGFALNQFKVLRAIAEDASRRNLKEISTWVMPARHHDGSVCSKSLAKQISDRQRDDKNPMSRRSPMTSMFALQGGKWTPHDLRRTGATLMGCLGVRPDIIEKCLNHTEERKIRRIYQRAELRPEMAEAWQLLGARLELLVQPADNIVKMHTI